MAQIYISYSQNNQEVAKKIRNALEVLGHTVWLDDPDTEFDRSLAEQLDRGLRESEIMVALLSPTSVKSRTVRREVALAKSLNMAIIPVLVERLPNVGEGEKYIDATENVEGAISRLIKVVEARAAKGPLRPPASLPETDEIMDDDDDDEANGGFDLRSPLSIAMIGLLIIVVIFALLSLTRPPDQPSETVSLTDVRSTVDAQASEAAVVRATNDAQATTIVELALTQTAIAAMPTEVETQEALETQETEPTSQDEPTEVALTETVTGGDTTVSSTSTATRPAASPTSRVAPATPTIAPSGPTEEPSPTPEGDDQGIILPTTAPTATLDIAQGRANNLLLNSGFESFTAASGGQVAQGWTAWAITGGDRPSYQDEPVYGAAGSNAARIHEGINAQQFSAEIKTFDGGLYQQASGIPAGALLRFSVFAYVWSSNTGDVNVSEDDGDVTLQVGIDPTGGTDPNSANIIWSEPIEQYDAYNEYSVTANAASGTVTVYIRATVDFPVADTAVYVDDALLFAGGG